MRVMFALADRNDGIMWMSDIELDKEDTLAFAAVKKALNKQLGGFYSGYKWVELVHQCGECDLILSYKEIK